jgi:hypothetical protein
MFFSVDLNVTNKHAIVFLNRIREKYSSYIILSLLVLKPGLKSIILRNVIYRNKLELNI